MPANDVTPLSLPTISNDSPISDPKDDQFDVAPFAKAIADGIANLPAPDGTVLALTGPWGCGKSSITNLVTYYLNVTQNDKQLKIISFNPWWYSNEDSLAQAFFQHLYTALDRALSEHARSVFLSLAKGLLTNGSAIAAAANLVTLGLGGDVAKSVASTVANVIRTERTAEESYEIIARELRSKDQKVLIVIDDIDRLLPEQALLVFRLVKSVGRLPNVIYLLAFDRVFAERLLAKRYPAERQFLDKIVQATWEVPLPSPDVLEAAILGALVTIGDHPERANDVRFRNVLADVINPLISSPRDLKRFVGTVRFSWAAIGREVDFSDLAAMEAIRLFRLPIYQKIRSHKAMLCGLGYDDGEGREARAKRYDDALLGEDARASEREFARRALPRLFPHLNSVWFNHGYDAPPPEWRAERRICSPDHFSTYFRFALEGDVLPRRVIEELLEKLGDPSFVKSFFRRHRDVVRRDGRSDLPIIFDDLIAASGRISDGQARSLLSALFEIADELDIERDADKGLLGIADNFRRIHWLLNALVRDRLTQAKRSELFRELLPRAALSWGVSLADRAYGEYHSRDDGGGKPVEGRLVDEPTLTGLVRQTLERLREASCSGKLLMLRQLVYVLYRWREFAGDEGGEVRTWTESQLSDDNFVLLLARRLTSTAWITSEGDRVSRGEPRVRLEGAEVILDVQRFLVRIDEIEQKELSDEEQGALARFREGVANARAAPGSGGLSVPT